MEANGHIVYSWTFLRQSLHPCQFCLSPCTQVLSMTDTSPKDVNTAVLLITYILSIDMPVIRQLKTLKIIQILNKLKMGSYVWNISISRYWSVLFLLCSLGVCVGFHIIHYGTWILEQVLVIYYTFVISIWTPLIYQVVYYVNGFIGSSTIFYQNLVSEHFRYFSFVFFYYQLVTIEITH